MIDLSAAMKARVENLIGLHHYGNCDDLNEASRTVASVLTDEQKNRMNWVRHRIARAHAVTGRKALYAVSGSSFALKACPTTSDRAARRAEGARDAAEIPISTEIPRRRFGDLGQRIAAAFGDADRSE